MRMGRFTMMACPLQQSGGATIQETERKKSESAISTDKAHYIDFTMVTIGSCRQNQNCHKKVGVSE
jgi:hypothetical protein